MEARAVRRAGGEAPAQREDWVLLGAAVAVALAAILWFGRETVFTIDELAWVIDSPGMSLRDPLEPYNGHLVLTSRLVYAALLDLQGTDYIVFRGLAAASVALLAVLAYAYARPAVGSRVALAPAVALLVFGAAGIHVLAGNGFTVVSALCCGLGALLALRREDRVGDAIACVLLCLGVLTYTVALPFVAGAAVGVLLGRDGWKRAWVPLVPAVIYGAWFLWSLGQVRGADSEVSLWNLLTLPAWVFQSVAAVLQALAGLDYAFTGVGQAGTGIGALLAVAALAGLGWRLARGPMSAGLAVGLAVLLALMAIQALAAGFLRTPGIDRYLYPTAVAVFVVAVEAARGWRPGRRALIAVWAITAISVGANVSLLREFGQEYRAVAQGVRATLSGVELAGSEVDPDFDPGAVDSRSPLAFTWGSPVIDGSPTEAYLTASDRYGAIGYSAQDLEDEDEGVRESADRNLIAALGLSLEPTEPLPGARCLRLRADIAGALLQPGDAAVLIGGGRSTVGLSRFGPVAVELGVLPTAQPQRVATPPDRAELPWRLVTSGGRTRLCRS